MSDLVVFAADPEEASRRLLNWAYYFVREDNKNKIAGLALEEETVSLLRPQASGDKVKTAEDYSSWSTPHIIPHKQKMSAGAGTHENAPVSPLAEMRLSLVQKEARRRKSRF